MSFAMWFSVECSTKLISYVYLSCPLQRAQDNIDNDADDFEDEFTTKKNVHKVKRKENEENQNRLKK